MVIFSSMKQFWPGSSPKGSSLSIFTTSMKNATFWGASHICRMKLDFEWFLFSTEFALKMHIFTLEKFWPTSALILTWPNLSFNYPGSPPKGVFQISPDFLFYRLRHEGSFQVLLVFLPHFSLLKPNVLTLAYCIPCWVSSTYKILFHGFPKYV